MYMPDYTTLWSQPVEPQLPRPQTPPRRTTSSAQDARRQAHEQALRQMARARAVQAHANGRHLPSRSSGGDPWGYTGLIPAGPFAGSSSHVALGGPSEGDYRLHQASAGLGDESWKTRMQRSERESGYAWSGSGVTQQEERELAEEEEYKLEMARQLADYGHSSIVVPGLGRTMQEEAQDIEDREAIAAAHPTEQQHHHSMMGSMGPASGSAASPSAAAGAGAARIVHPLPRVGTAATSSASERAPPPMPGGGGRGMGAADLSLMAEDRDVYEGEYTLDDGDAGINNGDNDDSNGGRGGPGRRGGRGGEVDLDAGMESMD